MWTRLWTVLTLCTLTYAQPATTHQVAGEWKGQCKSFPPLTGGVLTIDLTILPDGKVSGSVGDARIVDGCIRHRSSLEPRAFNHFEYRIDFKLAGPLSKRDDVTREGGRINLDWSGGDLKGWFVTSGPHLGGPKTIQLHTRDLVLKRTR